MAKDLVAMPDAGAADEQYALTRAQFGQLAEVPAELEWLANITNAKTKRAYKIGKVFGLRRFARSGRIPSRHTCSRDRLA